MRCVRAEPFETTLSPLWASGGVKLIVLPTAADRALVLENRQPAGLDANRCRKGILAYEVRTSTTSEPVTILPADRSDPCGTLSGAPYNLVPGQLRRVADALTLVASDFAADGSYRLRITR